MSNHETNDSQSTENTPERYSSVSSIGWGGEPISLSLGGEITSRVISPEDYPITTILGKLDSIVSGGIDLEVSITHFTERSYRCTGRVAFDDDALPLEAASAELARVYEDLPALLGQRISTCDLVEHADGYEVIVSDSSESTRETFSISLFKQPDEVLPKFFIESGNAANPDATVDSSILLERDFAPPGNATLLATIAAAIANGLAPRLEITDEVVFDIKHPPTFSNPETVAGDETSTPSKELVVYTKDFTSLHPNYPRFHDVVGQTQATKQILNIGKLFLDVNRRKAMGLDEPRGVILSGPENSGKTMLARALANELNMPTAEVLPGDILSNNVGESQRNLRNLYEDAAGNNEPTLVLVRRADLLFGRRAIGNSILAAALRSDFNYLASNTQAFPQILTICAVRSLIDFDEEGLNPGVFHRIIKLELPDTEGRRALFERKILKHIDAFSVQDTKGIAYSDFNFHTPEILQYTPDFADATKDLNANDISAIITHVLEERAMHDPADGPLPTITKSAIHEAITNYRSIKTSLSTE